MSPRRMTDWTLAARLSVLVVAAVLIGAPAQVRAVLAIRPDLAARASTVGTIVLLTGLGLAAAAVGSALAPRIGLSAPLLGGRLFRFDASLLWKQVGAGLAGGALAALALPVYYWGSARFSPELFQVGDAIRAAMGIPARVAIGGVLEEIVFRWGVLAVVAWAGFRLTGEVGPIVRWAAIIVAALAFAAAHLPGAGRLAGGHLTAGAILTGVAVNVWLGLIAGWLVFHWGLASAMIAHGSIHVVWAVAERLGASR